MADPIYPDAILPSIPIPRDRNIPKEVTDAMMAEEAMLMPESEKRVTAVKMLAAGYTVPRVALMLRVNPVAILKYRGDEDVQIAIAEGKAARKESLGYTLDDMSQDALATIKSILVNEDVSPQYRLKAAEMVLSRTMDDPESAAGSAISGVEIELDDRLRVIRARAATKHT